MVTTRKTKRKGRRSESRLPTLSSRQQKKVRRLGDISKRTLTEKEELSSDEEKKNRESTEPLNSKKAGTKALHSFLEGERN